MEWTKMKRETQYIRKLGSGDYEVLDIQPGVTRRGEEGFFITDLEFNLRTFSKDNIFDYVRMYGYASIDEVYAQHPDEPEMYLVEAIATVTASFNRDTDKFFETQDEAMNYIVYRWLAKAQKKRVVPSGRPMFTYYTPGDSATTNSSTTYTSDIHWGAISHS